MTARKPPGVSWQSWIDRQIEHGRARGDFDDLPGAGKPIEGIERPRDELWWVRDKLRREGVEYLPPSLAIRKTAAEARQKALDARSEQEARAILDEINQQIRHLNSHSVEGPPTTLMPLDVEEVLADRRRALAEAVDRPVEPSRVEADHGVTEAPPGSLPRRRLWQRLRAR